MNRTVKSFALLTLVATLVFGCKGTDPSNEEIKIALMENLKKSSGIISAGPGVGVGKACDVYRYLDVKQFSVREKSVNDNQATYKIDVRYLWTEDDRDIRAETKCELTMAEQYGPAVKGSEADGPVLKMDNAKTLVLGRFDGKWKYVSYD